MMEEDDDEEEEGNDGPAPVDKGRPPIYNHEALHEKLEDIAWTEEVRWDETLAITAREVDPIEDVEDDLSRELSFYNQVVNYACALGLQFFAGSILKLTRRLQRSFAGYI